MITPIYKQQGAVLVTTITMVTLVATLVLSMMHTLYLYIKTSSRMTLKQQSFYHLDAAALDLALNKDALKAQKCRMDSPNPNDAIRQLLARGGCLYQEGGRRYTYLTTDLGSYPCLKILSTARLYSSHHVLISILNEQQDVLQLRIGRPELNGVCKNHTGRVIKEGVLSWRYLPHGLLP